MKKLTALVLCLCLVCGLSACAQPEKEEEAKKQTYYFLKEKRMYIKDEQRQSVSFSYDKHGRPTAIELKLEENKTHKAEIEYDKKGNKIKEVYAITTSGGTRTRQTEYQLTYDGDKLIRSENGLLATMAWRIGGKPTYALEGSVFMGGATIQWLRDEMKMLSTAAESESVAQQVKDTGGVYLVPAFTGLGAPWWDQYSRGTLVGMTRGTGRALGVRAALEAIAYQSADLMQAMVQDCGFTPTRLQVDGGASANAFLMQFQADVMDVPVVRPVVMETTALGAALLAGLAVGVYATLEETAQAWQQDASFTPGMEAHQRKNLLSGWHKAVERAKDWAEH